MSFRNRVNPVKRWYARTLRNNPTPAEAKLWRSLRKDQLGVRFRRQVVILGWIVDFYCPKLHLVIEVDGNSHKGREEKDAQRTEVLEKHGFTIIRFTNDQVLNNIPQVLRKIRLCLKV